MPYELSRRQVLRLITLLSAGTAAGSVPFIAKFFANQVNAQTSVRVRENIATFIQSPEKVEALRTGIRVMQSRPVTNPTSWDYQANIHGTTDGRNLRAWNTCSHGNFFFFPWHRMYLYYFERILRQASGDPNLAIPYWNYSDFPDQRILPEPFRIPAESSNPLYVSQRRSGINEGTTVLQAANVSYTNAFQRTNFFHTTSSGRSFGGRRVSTSTHLGSDGGDLEGRPHNQIHSFIGGWMGRVESAARDPIFWLHHTNIDRLWERWLQQGNGRANPTGNSDWMNDRFTFFDENGTEVTLRGRDILNTAQQLNYRYDDDPSLTGEAQLSRNREGDEQSSQRTVANAQTLATTEQRAIALGDNPVTVTLPLMEDLGPAELFANRASQERLFYLNVERIEYNPRNPISYHIYINLPQGATPDPSSPYYAGMLSLFALPQRGNFSIAITDVVRELQRLNLMTGDSISVTFVPPPEDVAELQRTARSTQELQQAVRFNRVEIARE